MNPQASLVEFPLRLYLPWYSGFVLATGVHNVCWHVIHCLPNWQGVSLRITYWPS